MTILERIHAGIEKLRERRQFRREFLAFKSLSGPNRFAVKWEDCYPLMGEKKTKKTSFDRHYVYHTSWAARVLARTKPHKHVDISSSLYFAAIISAFIPTKFYDFRPPNLKLSGLTVGHADLLSLPFPSNSVPSISCMHVVEHIGLGRYGDPIAPQGDLQAIRELIRVTALGGDLLFVVPVGKRRLMFNAHRIYSYDDIIDYFSELALVEFALIPDDEKEGALLDSAQREFIDRQRYSCGCFWFRK
jgi:hypothetical protein